MKHACLKTNERGDDVILSVHRTYALAAKKMWHLWRTVPGLPFHVACCPDDKRKGNTLSFQEVLDAGDEEVVHIGTPVP